MLQNCFADRLKSRKGVICLNQAMSFCHFGFSRMGVNSPLLQLRRQPDNLVMLWEFKSLLLFISRGINSLYGL